MFVLPKSDLYLMFQIPNDIELSWYIKENIRSGVLNVSWSTSRFRFLGMAKVKSEKELPSFASASSMTIHHGTTMCCQDPRDGCW